MRNKGLLYGECECAEEEEEDEKQVSCIYIKKEKDKT